MKIAKFTQAFSHNWTLTHGIKLKCILAFLYLCLVISLSDLLLHMQTREHLISAIASLAATCFLISLPCRAFARIGLSHVKKQSLSLRECFKIDSHCIDHFLAMAILITVTLISLFILAPAVSYAFIQLSNLFLTKSASLSVSPKIFMTFYLLFTTLIYIISYLLLFLMPYRLEHSFMPASAGPSHSKKSKYYNVLWRTIADTHLFKPKHLLIFLGLGVLNLLGAALIGIGLIWTIPFTVLTLAQLSLPHEQQPTTP